MRLEQIYPFPHRTLLRELQRFPEAEVVWCQEEPKNMGAWFFADRMIEEVMVEIGMTAGRPVYVGRPAAASPATGLLTRHLQEKKTRLEEAMNVKTTPKASATKTQKEQDKQQKNA